MCNYFDVALQVPVSIHVNCIACDLSHHCAARPQVGSTKEVGLWHQVLLVRDPYKVTAGGD